MTTTLDQLPKVAQDLISKAKKAGLNTAKVVALSGELGSGKTTLTQEIARQLGVKENITSPTFVIIKSYNTTDTVFKKLTHIDAYRLSRGSELLHLGWVQLLEDKDNLIIVEWPENVPECIPKNAIYIELTHDKENTRMIKML